MRSLLLKYTYIKRKVCKPALGTHLFYTNICIRRGIGLRARAEEENWLVFISKIYLAKKRAISFHVTNKSCHIRSIGRADDSSHKMWQTCSLACKQLRLFQRISAVQSHHWRIKI